MAKLSDAQIKAIKFYATGEGEQPRKNTRDSLITNGFLNEDNTVTNDGYSAAGIERKTATVDEILELLEPVNDWTCETSILDSVPDQWSTPRVRNHNERVWDGLPLDEIKKDIKTAVPVGRAGRRFALKHAKHNH